MEKYIFQMSSVLWGEIKEEQIFPTSNRIPEIIKTGIISNAQKTEQNTEYLDVPEKKVIRAAKTQKVKIKNSYCQRNGSLDRTGPNRLA